MKVYAIVIRDNSLSESGFKILNDSSKSVGNDFTIKRFDAITPDTVTQTMKESKVLWNYPWVGKEQCLQTGLRKSAYKTDNPKARVACAMSHYLLWKTCIKLDEPVMILEHDAMFIQKIDFDIADCNMLVLGINSPLGATRLAREFYTTIMNNKQWVQPVPKVDHFDIPQGLAGNSAYIIKPAGASRMLELVNQHGLWPNDALMCRQLVPRLGVTKKFYTKVQGLRSTTTL
jgi:GR25 family glycosyltransferase involved in LPS biosynthesis